MDLDAEWERIEKAAGFEQGLYDLLCDYIQSFSAGKENEIFYAFALDCNAIYNDIYPCFNTVDGLAHSIEFYKYKTDREILSLKWNMGDWKYAASGATEWKYSFTSLGKEIEAHLDALSERYTDFLENNDIERDDFEDEWNRRYMMSVARVAMRIEVGDALRSLKKTPDFAVFALNDDEIFDESINRHLRLRNQWNRGKGLA